MTEPKKTKGGARKGSGRRALYGEPLTAIVAVQLDEAQSKAVIAYAKRHKINVTLLMREASLIQAGAAKLGIGLDGVAPGWAEPRETGKWPLKFTARQHAAVSKAAERVGLTLRQYVLEATLAHIGKPELGERGEIASRMKKLSKMGPK